MSARSSIEWLLGGGTWNPIRARNLKTGKVGWFCEHVSELCRNCYAEGMNNWIGTGLAYKPVHLQDVEIFLDQKLLTEPLRWKRPRLIFPCSMTDLFGRWVTDEMLGEIWSVMRRTPQHTYLTLTKRPARLSEWARRVAEEPSAERPFLDNQWLGYSGADEAGVRALLGTPAKVRWLSLEPILGAVPDLSRYYFVDRDGFYPSHFRMIEEPHRTKLIDLVDWVVVGGESGPRARPTHLQWIRDVITLCRAHEVPVFVKQIGTNAIEYSATMGHDIPWSKVVAIGETTRKKDKKGGDMSLWPPDLRVREFPKATAA